MTKYKSTMSSFARAFGLENPEPLKYDLSRLWSRHIDREHRLVYQVFDKELLIYSCRYHYDK